jgi:hypothetical protein
MAGKTPRAQEKIGLVMKSRRKELMAISYGRRNGAMRQLHICQRATHSSEMRELWLTLRI